MKLTDKEEVVKSRVKDVLDDFAHCWWDMPVPSGWGKSQLDFTICFCGLFVAIETKRPDQSEYLTGPQRITAWNIACAGGKVFIISTEESINLLRRWLEKVHERALAAGAVHADGPQPVPTSAPRRRGKAHTAARHR